MQGLPLNNKLKALKAPLRNWSKKKFEHLEITMRELESVIHNNERVSDERALNVMKRLD